MKLVIQRDKWLRGKEDEGKLLRPSDGRMCCLGFYSLALGIPEDAILGNCSPDEVEQARERYPEWLFKPESITTTNENDEEVLQPISSELANELMVENDRAICGDEDYDLDDYDSEDLREQRIAELFAKAGVEVTFE